MKAGGGRLATARQPWHVEGSALYAAHTLSSMYAVWASSAAVAPPMLLRLGD